jgi:hypothetical protein
MTNETLTVANEILHQLGGARRLGMMLGAHAFGGTADSLSFRFRARATNGSNALRIVLDPSDTYTIEFLSLRGRSRIVKKTFEGAYAEDLRQIFESETGLYLNLGTMAAGGR